MLFSANRYETLRIHQQRIYSTHVGSAPRSTQSWPRGYKTFFVLNSAEHEISPANKTQIINNYKSFLLMNTKIYYNSLDRSVSNRRDVWLFFYLSPCFIEVPVFNTNHVDPDQTNLLLTMAENKSGRFF